MRRNFIDQGFNFLFCWLEAALRSNVQTGFWTLYSRVPGMASRMSLL